MIDEEIALLKADNERLNKIMGIVVEQNELLKLENAFLKKAVTPKDIINSFAKIGMAIKSNENALAKLDNGLRNVTNDQVNSKDGNNNLTEAIVGNKEGNSIDANDVVSSKQGISNNTAGLVNFNDGNNSVTSPVATSKDGNSIRTTDHATSDSVSTPETEVMPQAIESTNKIIWALEKELRASGYNRISYSGVNNAAKLLIHFYNKGEGSYPELKKVTGHSTDGIAKFIMSMKKRGWIHRFGFQQFALTDTGVALIKQALTKSREN